MTPPSKPSPMTPEQHATAIIETAEKLNDLVKAAREDDVIVVDYESPRLIYRPLMLGVLRQVVRPVRAL